MWDGCDLLSQTAAPLIGVVLGGLLAIIGQVLANFAQARTENKRHAAACRAAARLQQHSYWFFQDAAAKALHERSWPTLNIDERYMPTRDDMHFLSSVLEPEEWRLFSTAIRLQLEIMQIARDNAGRPMSGVEAEKTFAAYDCAGEARSVMSTTSGVEAFDHDPGPLRFQEDEVRRALSHRLLASLADKWVDRLTASEGNR